MFSSALRKTSFIQDSIAPRPDHIFLVRGKDPSGRHAWYYVVVDKGKRDAFRFREGAASLSLTDYGHILFSGFGVNPPEAIRIQMEEEYGFKE